MNNYEKEETMAINRGRRRGYINSLSLMFVYLTLERSKFKPDEIDSYPVDRKIKENKIERNIF